MICFSLLLYYRLFGFRLEEYLRWQISGKEISFPCFSATNLDTVAQIFEKIMLEDFRNPYQQGGVEGGLPENLVGILPGAGNCFCKFRDRETSFMHDFPYPYPYIHAPYNVKVYESISSSPHVISNCQSPAFLERGMTALSVPSTRWIVSGSVSWKILTSAYCRSSAKVNTIISAAVS